MFLEAFTVSVLSMEAGMFAGRNNTACLVHVVVKCCI